MAVATNKIKGRIKSVTGAYKVTSAMKLISTVKVKKYRNKLFSVRTFNDEINNVLKVLFENCDDIKSNFLISPNSEKKLYVIFTSSLGLCGQYNENIYKFIDKIISKNDILVFGNKGITHFNSKKYNVIKLKENYNNESLENLSYDLSKELLSIFAKGEYSEIHFIYTKYKNALNFAVDDLLLLPCKLAKFDDIKNYKLGPILEPNPQEIFDKIFELYIRNTIYGLLIESEVSEQTSRSNAMENATNNAKELIDELNLEFNKIRQSSITQEIVEVVSASKSV